MRREALTAGRAIEALRRQPLLGASVVALLMAGAFSVAVGTALGLANFRDVGYPDSGNLLSIEHVVRSGFIYPDNDRPPYQVTIYGPLTYALLAIPYRLAQAASIAPRVLVRLGVLGALGVCVLLIFLIGRRLYGSRPIALLCALFAVSALPLDNWTTQIRGDFLALAFSLLSVYWFLRANGRRPQAIGAAICAGTALLVKQTFFAASIAIATWLVYRRRYKEAVLWATGVALTVAGGYAIVWWREPLMLKNFAAVRRPFFEHHVALLILWDAVSQPVAPFAAVGGLLALWKPVPERLLFLIYCVVAWLVAIFTIQQVGGAINYFWEPLVASAVLAGPGLCELQRKANRTPALVTAMLLVLLLRAFVPMLRQEFAYLTMSYANVSDYQARRAKWKSFVSIVSGRRLLSTFSDVTVHSATPELPDPLLTAQLALRGRWNFGPVVAQINASMFELIVIGEGQAEPHIGNGYRGLWEWDDGMWRALKRNYGLACVFEGMEVWLPNRGSGELLPRLSGIGCLAVTKEADSGSGRH
jgi:hypothetical protein